MGDIQHIARRVAGVAAMAAALAAVEGCVSHGGKEGLQVSGAPAGRSLESLASYSSMESSTLGKRPLTDDEKSTALRSLGNTLAVLYPCLTPADSAELKKLESRDISLWFFVNDSGQVVGTTLMAEVALQADFAKQGPDLLRQHAITKEQWAGYCQASFEQKSVVKTFSAR